VMPSAYWGDRQIWDTRVNNHNMMIDRKGRLWLTAAVRGLDNPAFCKEGSDHPSAKLFPLKQSHRQLAMLDPKTMKYTFVDTCFDTHHLQFGFDKDDTLWTSGGGPVVGWLDTKVFDETGDAAKAQGWTALVLDTDGNGKRDAYVEPDQPVDPSKDKRIPGGFYAIMPAPWMARCGARSACSAARVRSCGSIPVEPARNGTRRNLQCPARQRASRQLRPAQMQGSAQRAQGYRRSLPGGLDALPVSGAGLRRYRRQQRRGQLSHRGRSAQHTGARQ